MKPRRDAQMNFFLRCCKQNKAQPCSALAMWNSALSLQSRWTVVRGLRTAQDAVNKGNFAIFGKGRFFRQGRERQGRRSSEDLACHAKAPETFAL
jgi:hypothetical protein